MIISAFVEILMPDKDFKKYTKLIMGLIVMIIIIHPLAYLSDNEELFRSVFIESNNYIDKSKMMQNIELFESKQKEQIIEQYSNQLALQIKEHLETIGDSYTAAVNINVDRDMEHDKFGTIKSVNITLSKKHSDKNKQYNSVDIKAVKAIEIAPIRRKEEFNYSHIEEKIESEIENKNSEEERKLKAQIIDVVHTTYKIPIENIKINFRTNEG